jgi:S-adenosylmethionine synthetase
MIVGDLKQTPLEKQRLEIVERKGLGHPDSMQGVYEKSRFNTAS